MPAGAPRVEHLARRRLAVEVLAAAAADPQRRPLACAARTARSRRRARRCCAARAASLAARRRAGEGRVHGPAAARSAECRERSMPRDTCIFPYSAQRTSDGITLPGLSSALGIERMLERQHLLALGRRELHAHRGQLLDADAVLAGHGAAHRDAGLEDVGTEQLGTVQLVGVVGVEQDQGVQVAVAGVEHVGAAQAVGLLHAARWRAACRPSRRRGIVESMHM